MGPVDSPLDGRPSSGILVYVEPEAIRRELEPDHILEPARNASEGGGKAVGVCRRTLDQREVEVLGEAIRLEVALLETRPALEDECPAQDGIPPDPCQ